LFSPLLVGIGHGKAPEVAEAIRKGTEAARKAMTTINVQEGTIPHRIDGEFASTTVVMRPASQAWKKMLC